MTTLESNPSHCRYARGDQTCAERYGEKRPFCTSAACDAESEGVYGCVAERPADDCYYACGGDSDVTVDDSCVLAGDGDGDGEPADAGGDMTDGDGDDNGEMPCMGPADCDDGGAPFCDLVTGVCVGCDSTETPDSACAEFNPQLPVCLADVCVACTADKTDACVEGTPICDLQSNACVGCSDHDQCPSSACNLAVGSCFDPAATLHVDGDGDECDSADGSETKPYCELGEALSFAGPEALILLHEQDEQAMYSEANEITTTVALLAADGESPILTMDSGEAPLSVSASGVLFVRGVTISAVSGEGLGLDVTGGHAWVQQCKIVNNTDGGIRVNDGGSLILENSFVGGDKDDERAIEVIDGEISVVYSTLAAGKDGARALSCTDSSDVVVRNSILVSLSDDPEIDCANAEVIDCFTEASADMSFESGWFTDFGKGDFHLNPDAYPSEIMTAASWRSGDPTTDIDGNDRPTADATSDFAGADRP
ncbi:right-handed parallel beta-helix repeat-containing protein [Enhygromyxa salina]|uniref:right-handed parallel beta-helix repeat-containing protein n=1 Tax=Enhygromyxa salina TaxID=215803 RepID=UPI000D033DD9|nr:right-handed parallel beta-helix repeat-containing protein [Enhygromyxa salina]